MSNRACSTEFVTDEMVDVVYEALSRGWFEPGEPIADTRDKVRDALVAAMRAAWRPIESAPRDGTRFLAFGGMLEDVTECRYSQDGKCWVTDPYVIHDDDRPSRHPTRWQPLPPPPELSDG